MLLSIYTSVIDDPDYSEIFELYYKNYRLTLINDAYRIIKDYDYAQDIVHDAYMRIAKNIDKIDFGDNPLPILRTVTRNCAFNYYHKLKNESVSYEWEELLTIPDKHDSMRDIETRSAIDAIADFVEKMHPFYADVFTLHYVHDLSAVQIASLLDIKASTVRKRLQRIRDAVTQNLPKEYFNE